MITADKIAIYEKYGGDIDGWVRSRTKIEKTVMRDADWSELDNLIQRLSVVKRGLASTDYVKETEELLITIVPDGVVREKLKQLV